MSQVQPRILILDDDLQILSALKRVLRKHFAVCVFDDAQVALQALTQEFFPVIISDMRMPKMDGATFLQKSFVISPNSQRILLTGYADIESTIEAVNQGHIQCYLQKPWSNKDLLERVNSAAQTAEQTVRLTQISKNVLHLDNIQEKSREVHRNLIDFIGQISNIEQDSWMEHNHRVAQHIHILTHELKWSKQQILHCYLASLFYRLGLAIAKVELDTAFYAQNAKSQQTQMAAIERGAQLLATFEHLRPVAKLVRQLTRYSQCDHNDITAIDLLKVVIDYDLLVQGQLLPQKMSHEQTINWLLTNNKRSYSRIVVKHYAKWLGQQMLGGHSEVNLLLSPQQILALLKANPSEMSFMLVSPVTTSSGNVLITQGQMLNVAKVKHLIEIEQQQKIQLLVSVKKVAVCQVNLAS
ncbi:response regulator (plasmid) [Catenovulum sp. SX2]|uniref:response regulator n=1 Tax=Catenovulum sp. SX2 TaxID=3398614 RepID=UPI003F84BD9C